MNSSGPGPAHAWFRNNILGLVAIVQPVSRRAGALAVGLLGIALLSAVGAPRAHAASCSGSIQGAGSFSFSCDTQLGTDGNPSTYRFILEGQPGFMTPTSATVSSPAGVVCVPNGIDQFCGSSATIPAGTTVAGSVVAEVEGSVVADYCDRTNFLALDAFFSGSPLGAYSTHGLACASSGGRHGAGTPSKKCKKAKKGSATAAKKKCKKKK